MISLLVILFMMFSKLPLYAHVNAGANALADWHWRWDVISVLVIFGTIYARGWLRLKKIGGEAGFSQLMFYALALSAIGCALLSPLDKLASYLLMAHMAQHESCS
jgi:cytochrome c oxidase assembly factor CtaG